MFLLVCICCYSHNFLMAPGSKQTPLVDEKHTCSYPVKQSPSCCQHNMNGDIFKWGNMGTIPLPGEGPEEASLVGFSY